MVNFRVKQNVEVKNLARAKNTWVETRYAERRNDQTVDEVGKANYPWEIRFVFS